MSKQGGIASRTIKGFKFRFMYAFGYDGVLIDAESIHAGSPDFIEALNEAKRLHLIWRSMCSVMNSMLQLPSFKYESGDVLLEWREKSQSAIEQTDWVLENDELETFKAFIVLIDAELSGRLAHQSAENKPPIPGYVYVLKSPTGAYKIGKTKDPNNRLRVFSVKMPFEVEYVCLIQTPDMNTLERTLHQQFKDKHINGEWFNLNEADIEYLKGLAL